MKGKIKFDLEHNFIKVEKKESIKLKEKIDLFDFIL